MSTSDIMIPNAMASAIPAIRLGLALVVLVGLGAFAARVEAQPSHTMSSEIRAHGDTP
jgi:hypothetical protein